MARTVVWPRPGLRLSVVICLAVASLVVAPGHADSPEYVVGPGDVLLIDILNSDMSFPVTVLPDGSITLSFAGRVPCAGLTLAELAAELSHRLSQEIADPRVLVSVVKPRPRYVYTLGSGVAARQTELVPDWRVTQLLAAVGGVTARPNVLVAWLRRQNGAVLPIGIAALMTTGDMESDVTLREGDTLVVERVDAAGVYVTGGVVVPGAYGLPSGAGAAKAIQAAGGVTPGAAISAVTVWHTDRTSTTADLTAALVRGDLSADTPVRAGDVVVVPSTASHKTRVTVVGAVRRPGHYWLMGEGGATVSAALDLAGGPLSEGLRITILRSGSSGPAAEALLTEPVQDGDILCVEPRPETQ